MNHIVKIVSFIVCAVGLFSCRKVINVDLNAAAPRIVIEGTINDQPGPYQVKITHSISFSQSNVFPAVSGATVTLTDDAGSTETLTEVTPGIYQTATTTGTPGRTYTLSVTADGKTYTATSKMPAPVGIDSLNISRGIFRGEKNVRVFFMDPAATDNWYRFVQTVNDSVHKDIYIAADILREGKHIDETLFNNDADSLQAGDSVTIVMQTIDKGVYDYFRTLQQISQGGDPGASPANPVSNFNNGALGYFNAYGLTQKAIRIN